MSLYITIRINDERPLETYYAHCIKIDKNNIGTYEVGKYGKDLKLKPSVGTIIHKRNLGASELAWRTIKEVMEKDHG